MSVHSFGKIDLNNVITDGKVSVNPRLFVFKVGLFIFVWLFLSGVD